MPSDPWSEIVSGMDDQGPIREALRTGRPVRVDSVLRDSRVADVNRAYYADMGLVAFAAIPTAGSPRKTAAAVANSDLDSHSWSAKINASARRSQTSAAGMSHRAVRSRIGVPSRQDSPRSSHQTPDGRRCRSRSPAVQRCVDNSRTENARRQRSQTATSVLRLRRAGGMRSPQTGQKIFIDPSAG